MASDDLLTERLLRVVDEGRRTATYKLALLLALIDAAAGLSDRPRSGALLRSTYRNLAPGTPLWLRGREFVDAIGPLDLVL